jgi:methionyl aminopeptidase
MSVRKTLCWCGSGFGYALCHGPFDRPGPGADQLLAAHPFSWAVRPAPAAPRRKAPAGVRAPDYATGGEPRLDVVGDVRSVAEIEAVRHACGEAAAVLRHLVGMVRPGITTDALDAEAYEECQRRRAYPSTLNYHGYTKSICTSVNEVICHGIPDSRPLRSGDIVNLDVSVFVGGAHGDCSVTVCVGEVNPIARRLVDAARACLNAGVKAVRPGRPFSDIGRAIEDVAVRGGYSVVRQFVGHGIGPLFHTGLQVLHHYDPSQTRLMQPGMVFTVEPMINAGTHRAYQWPDGWTAVTADLARSAQFEHTVLCTRSGVEVLTL